MVLHISTPESQHPLCSYLGVGSSTYRTKLIVVPMGSYQYTLLFILTSLIVGQSGIHRRVHRFFRKFARGSTKIAEKYPSARSFTGWLRAQDRRGWTYGSSSSVFLAISSKKISASRWYLIFAGLGDGLKTGESGAGLIWEL